VSNPDISNPDVSNPDVSNSNVANPDVSNPDVSNQNIAALSISDATYKVTNVGNTSASYHVKLVGNAPANAHLQLIISKAYQNPISINCQLLQEQRNVVLANINDPVFEDTSNLTDPNIPDPRSSNATFYLRPGETVLVTLRGTVDRATMQNITTQVAPVTVPHAAQTYAAPLFISISALPDATFGGAYNQALQAIGGKTPYAWGVASGSLPAGLSLSTGGQITGSPTTVGTSTFTVQVTDANSSVATKGLTLSVNKGGTTASLSSSANPSVLGQSVTLTATVSAAAPVSGTPTGTATFKDGSTTLGTATLVGGSATFGTSALAVGSHSITMSYGGDGNFTGSTSTPLGQTVNKANTTTSLSSSANPTVVGQPVTLTATVSAAAPGFGTPTGSVAFLDGAVTLGTVTLTNGSATLSTSALTLGSHSISAGYGGDGGFLGSTSTALAQIVNKVVTGTVVTPSANPSVFGQSVNFTAKVSAVAPGSGTPSGSATFLDGLTTLGTAVLAGGSATFSTSTLAVGTHSITVTYAGDGSFLGSSSGVLAQTVNKASTATSLTSSANPSTAGQSVKFTATVSPVAPGAGAPTGTVTFKDGTTTLGTAALAGGKATLSTSMLSAGSHSITAVYGGDANFFGSTSGILTQSVGYRFTGFISPLATAGTYSSPTFSGSFNLTRGVPIKWQLQDASGTYLSDLSTTRLLQAVANVGCPGTPGTQTILLYSPTTGAKGGSTFRSGSNQFIFNWDTSSGTAPGCYTLVLQLADGSQRATIVQLN
jgi:hypothetical protein